MRSSYDKVGQQHGSSFGPVTVLELLWTGGETHQDTWTHLWMMSCADYISRRQTPCLSLLSSPTFPLKLPGRSGLQLLAEPSGPIQAQASKHIEEARQMVYHTATLATHIGSQGKEEGVLRQGKGWEKRLKLGRGSGLNPGPPALSAPPPCPTFAQLVGIPTLLVARLLSLLPRALSNLSTGPLDFMVSGWLGSWLLGLNNAGAWPGASWKQPRRGSRFPWVEGRLSGWCVEKPGPGSGGKCRREGGRSLLQEVGWGRMWGRPGDQIPRIYPAGSVSLRSLALPSSGAASHPVGHRMQGSVVLRSSPGISQWRRVGIQVSGQGSRASGEHCVPSQFLA